jgi:hypothetical protein
MFVFLVLFVSVALSATQSFSVVNSGSSAWSFSGDAAGNNPTLTASVNDTLTFNVNAIGHLFAIHTRSGA